MNTAVSNQPTQEGAIAAQTAEQTALQAATEAKHAQIKANFNNLVDIKETKFNFRKVKDEATGIETKRPSVTIPLPTPSVEGIVSIIEKGGKGLDLLIDAVYEVINDIAREIVNADEAVTAENFPYDKLSWEAIANLPKAERRGGGIPKETWEDFKKDYIEVMPSVTGKKKESVELIAEILFNKFQKIKHNKAIVAKIAEQLDIYINNTTNGEQFQECYEFLVKKAQEIQKTDYEAALADAL